MQYDILNYICLYLTVITNYPSNP